MRIGVIGCAGRMGRANLREVIDAEGLELIGGTERTGHSALGEDVGVLAGGDPLGVMVHDRVEELVRNAEAVIEFSTPEASVAHARISAEHGCAHVIGTTGLEDDHRAALEAAGQGAAIVWAPNMSQGVNLLLGLVSQVARALDAGFDIEILEMHHRAKVDAPSGTALALGEAAAEGRGVRLAEVADRGRDGITGSRRRGHIGFAALRGGDVVGDHSVIFAGEGERIELTHKASNRQIYARGAVRAARWAAGQAPGLYGMADVLGLSPRDDRPRPSF